MGIYCYERILSQHIEFKRNSRSEIVWSMVLEKNGRKVLLCLFYQSVDGSIKYIQELAESPEIIRDSVIVVGGDFNLTPIDWVNLSS